MLSELTDDWMIAKEGPGKYLDKNPNRGVFSENLHGETEEDRQRPECPRRDWNSEHHEYKLDQCSQIVLDRN
jgi:hypothetical protein